MANQSSARNEISAPLQALWTRYKALYKEAGMEQSSTGVMPDGQAIAILVAAEQIILNLDRIREASDKITNPAGILFDKDASG